MRTLVLFVLVLTLALSWNSQVCESTKSRSRSHENKALSNRLASKWKGAEKLQQCHVKEKPSAYSK